MLFVLVLRSLPPLAKKYVLEMLYMDSALPAKSVEEWVLSDGFTKHRVAIDRLVQLRIFSEEKYVPYWIVCNFFYETGWLEIESNFGKFMLFLSMLVNTVLLESKESVYHMCEVQLCLNEFSTWVLSGLWNRKLC